jgi:SAM-dependent methyltransferase
LNSTVLVAAHLRAHPAVHDVAVVTYGSSLIYAFVVPDHNYIADVLGYRHAELSALAKWRKIYDLTQLAKAAASAPIGFNTLGWNSSYTRKPLPDDDMREWLQTTVADILSLEPKRVYEVGCGTGMLLMKIAPSCSSYVAADFAPTVVSRLREQLLTVPDLRESVHVMERAADNFDDFEHDSFDTVVINSVVQYFPSVAYLTKVLERAVSTVQDGGRVFVGDEPNLTLLPVFASSVAISQASDEISIRELRDQIQRRIQIEPQLILSPAYFDSLQTRFPRLSNVEIHLRRDRADNEMSKYRYNAILHVGERRKVDCTFTFLDWTDQEWDLNEIRAILERNPRDCVGLKRVRNSRLIKDLAMLEKIRTADPTQTVRELREAGDEDAHLGIHPQDLIDLGGRSDRKVVLSWKACRSDGSYDAVFIPRGTSQAMNSTAINWPMPEDPDFVHFANAPGQNKFRSQLIDQLLQHCEHGLPGDVVPSSIVLVDVLPRNEADGAAHPEIFLQKD